MRSEVQGYFDSISLQYDFQAPEWKKLPHLIDFFRKANGLVLDIGCGSGILREGYPNSIGVDISPRMLMIAQERGYVTVQARAEALPFLAKTFNEVLIRQVLHYCHYPRQVLEEARKVLIRSGCLRFSSNFCPHGPRLTFWRVFKLATQPLRLHLFTKTDLLNLIISAGFKIIMQESFRIPRSVNLSLVYQPCSVFPSYERFIGWVEEQLDSGIINQDKLNYEDAILTYWQNWLILEAKPS